MTFKIITQISTFWEYLNDNLDKYYMCKVAYCKQHDDLIYHSILVIRRNSAYETTNYYGISDEYKNYQVWILDYNTAYYKLINHNEFVINYLKSNFTCTDKVITDESHFTQRIIKMILYKDIPLDTNSVENYSWLPIDLTII